ncbi:MAG: ATP-binding protein [Thermodesulfobacteriota bacterium]
MDVNIHRKVFESFKDGLIITDENLNIIDMNDACEILINTSKKNIIGSSCSKILPEEMFLQAEKSFSEERDITEDEVELRVYPHDPVLIQITFSPYYSNTGRTEGLTIQLKDIEGIKFLSGYNAQQSITSNFENLILGMAHELKNPLSGIKGAAQLLKNKPSSEELSKCSEIITKEADRLIDHLDRLKRIDDFAEEQFEEFDIHEILLDIIYLESMTSDKDINFEKNFDVALPLIMGDENSIKQVFINIVKNAVQAVQANGEIKIVSRWVNDYKIKSNSAIMVSITDNGPGIPGNELEHVFTPFFSTKSEGTGLGLFISNRIISKHGGAIFVESEVGIGTEFKIYLPA